MKINAKDGRARIFGKALSALGPDLSRKDPVTCKENWKVTEARIPCLPPLPNVNEPTLGAVMIPSFEVYQVVEANESSYEANNVIQTVPSDIHSWVEESCITAIDETLRMVPNNPFEEWIRKNRLLALGHHHYDQHSSSTSLSSPYTTDSNEEMYSSDSQVASESSENLLSSKSNSLEDIAVSNIRYESEEHDRPIFHQQEGMKYEFSKKRSFSRNQANSRFHNEVEPVYKNDKQVNFVCISTNTSSNQRCHLKNIGVKNLEFQTKRRNCCEPTTKKKNNVARLPGYNVASVMTLKSPSGFFDSHCHIDFLLNDENFRGTYTDYMAEHKHSYPDSYKGSIAVFCRPWTFAKVQEWRKHLEQDKVWGAFGCHPKQAKYYNANIERHLENALDHPKVKALGEIGLDYSKKNAQFKDDQHFVFRRQLQIAQRRKLRVVIHCRDADDDAIKIMHEILPKDAVFHLHCFTGSWEKAQKWIEEFPNIFIGITNLVTFPDADKTHEVARNLPLNRLLLETDAPFFVPKKAPKGTKYSHPGMAIHVAAQIAALKNVPVEEVLHATCANTRFMYNIS